jgi:RNA polymerase sigma-70 factor (ECF subfamily)
VNEAVARFRLTNAEESAVIALASAGDAEAFDELVRRTQSRVRNFMRRLCNQPDMADDLAQQAFVKAWKSIGRLRSPAAFHGYMRKIMISVWMDELRREKIKFEARDEMDESLDVSAYVSAAGAPPGARLDLDAALGKLAPPMRLCIALAYGDGLSHTEISEETGIPLGTVKSYISRGAAKMRELLADYRKGV